MAGLNRDVDGCLHVVQVKRAYRNLATKAHPDKVENL